MPKFYLWAPRCRVCGQAMVDLMRVPGRVEHPDWSQVPYLGVHCLCPYCRNENLIGPALSWRIVTGALQPEEAGFDAKPRTSGSASDPHSTRP